MKKRKIIRNTKISQGGLLQTGLNASRPTKKFKSQTLFWRVLGMQSSQILLNMVNHSTGSHFQKEYLDMLKQAGPDRVDFKRSSFRGAAWQGSLNSVFIGPFLFNRIGALQNTAQVQHENMGPEECGRSCLLRGKDYCNAIRYDRWEISAYIRGEIRTLPLQVRNDYKSQEIKHDWLTKKML